MDIQKMREKIKKIKVDYDFISVKRTISHLKNEIRYDNNTKLWGYIFGLIGFMGFLASTIMTIVGGLKTHKTTLGLIGFVIGIIFCQLVVYGICIKESTIKQKFPRYYFVAKILQLTLFSISINYNYKFFNEKTLWNLALSIALEASILLTTTIGGDFRLLNYQENKIKRIESAGLISIFRMMLFNKLHKLRMDTIRDYSNNLKDLTFDLSDNQETFKIIDGQKNVLTESSNKIIDNPKLEPVKIELGKELNQELEKVKSELSQENKKLSQELGKVKNVILLKEKDLTILKDEIATYLKENFKNGDTIPTGKIRQIFDLTESQWKKIKNELDCFQSSGTSLKYKESTI
ncbi:MAG: hypothetical protein EHM20_00260 [Alphaproteobacteria bacterium]|nr:MAG: hypothetical protein EHM20_00260 [Alphaproteobacteria bacterium]